MFGEVATLLFLGRQHGHKPEKGDIEEVEGKTVSGINIPTTIPEGVIGRVVVDGAGYIDVKD